MGYAAANESKIRRNPIGYYRDCWGIPFFWRGGINFRRGPNRLIATLQNVTDNTTFVEILLAGGGGDFEIEYLLLPFGGFWSSIYGAVLIE